MKKSTILLLLAAAMLAIVIVFFPPTPPLSDEAKREITEIIRQKYPNRSISIRPISLIGARAESFDPVTRGSGSIIHYFRRGLSGWKITEVVYSTE